MKKENCRPVTLKGVANIIKLWKHGNVAARGRKGRRKMGVLWGGRKQRLLNLALFLSSLLVKYLPCICAYTEASFYLSDFMSPFILYTCVQFICLDL